MTDQALGATPVRAARPGGAPVGQPRASFAAAVRAPTRFGEIGIRIQSGEAVPAPPPRQEAPEMEGRPVEPLSTARHTRAYRGHKVRRQSGRMLPRREPSTPKGTIRTAVLA